MEDEKEKVFDIRERAFNFGVRTVRLCRYAQTKHRVNSVIVNQLIASGTSIGANLEEAYAGQSTNDFIHKNSISLKEARETVYWLRVLLQSYDFSEAEADRIQSMINEATELSRILGKIIVVARSKKQ